MRTNTCSVVLFAQRKHRETARRDRTFLRYAVSGGLTYPASRAALATVNAGISEPSRPHMGRVKKRTNPSTLSGECVLKVFERPPSQAAVLTSSIRKNLNQPFAWWAVCHEKAYLINIALAKPTRGLALGAPGPWWSARPIAAAGGASHASV